MREELARPGRTVDSRRAAAQAEVDQAAANLVDELRKAKAPVVAAAGLGVVGLMLVVAGLAVIAIIVIALLIF